MEGNEATEVLVEDDAPGVVSQALVLPSAHLPPGSSISRSSSSIKASSFGRVFSFGERLDTERMDEASMVIMTRCQTCTCSLVSV